MIKMILHTILVLALIFYCFTEWKITFKPFSISIDNAWNGLGFVLVFVGLMICIANAQNRGIEKGYEKAINDSIELIEHQSKKIKEEE